MPPKTLEENLQSLAHSSATIAMTALAGKFLKLPKLDDDVDIHEWQNECDALIEDRLGAMGTAFATDITTTFDFNRQGDGSYTVTDKRGTLDPAESLIEGKLNCSEP